MQQVALGETVCHTVVRHCCETLCVTLLWDPPLPAYAVAGSFSLHWPVRWLPSVQSDPCVYTSQCSYSSRHWWLQRKCFRVPSRQPRRYSNLSHNCQMWYKQWKGRRWWEGVMRVYMDPPVGNVLPPTTWGLSSVFSIALFKKIKAFMRFAKVWTLSTLQIVVNRYSNSRR